MDNQAPPTLDSILARQSSAPQPAPTVTPTDSNTPPSLDSILARQQAGSSAQGSTIASSDPTASQATVQAIQAGADPSDLAAAKKQLGDQDYIGYCESFVEGVTGEGWKGTSAIDAWRNQSDKAVVGTKGIQPGDAIYFYPDESNQNFGHTGIYAGNNKFISATDNGIQQYDLNDWHDLTGQEILGYIPQGRQNGQ